MGVFDLFGKDRRGGDRDRRGDDAFGRNDSDRRSSGSVLGDRDFNGTYKSGAYTGAYSSPSDSFGSSVGENPADDRNPVSVFMPSSYDEVEKIIDALKANKTAVVHLTELKTETALRILDMLSGAIYALGGGVYEMQKNIFMFSPCGVEVHEG